MTAKIDWYREVLELEPNSRVFFPLAKLLAEENQTSEAIKILEHGIDRHPEYLEARLLLIELLHKNGLKEKCDMEAGKLGKIFASYPGFWHAWSASLANAQPDSEMASLMRFIAANFINGPVKLNEVINRGLDAIIHDEKLAYAPKAIPEPPANSPEIQDVLENNQEELLADLDATLDAAQMDASREEEEINTEEPLQPAMEDVAETVKDVHESEPDVDIAPILEEPEVEEALAEEEALPEAVPDDEILPVPEESGEIMEDNSPESLLESAVEEIAAQAAYEMTTPDADEELLPEMEETGASEDAAVAEDENLAKVEAESSQEEPASAEFVEEALPEAEDDSAILPVPEEEEAPEDAEASGTEQTELALEDALPEKSAVDEVAQAEAELVAGLDLPAMEEDAQDKSLADADSGQDDLLDNYEEEQVSLRTRSMAEVLAEQGDLKGAIEIYEELAQAATSADELRDINQRIATLNTRLSMASASSGFQTAEAEAQARSKEKLLGMLEALAQRVEARANN